MRIHVRNGERISKRIQQPESGLYGCVDDSIDVLAGVPIALDNRRIGSIE